MTADRDVAAWLESIPPLTEEEVAECRRLLGPAPTPADEAGEAAA